MVYFSLPLEHFSLVTLLPFNDLMWPLYRRVFVLPLCEHFFFCVCNRIPNHLCSLGTKWAYVLQSTDRVMYTTNQKVRSNVCSNIWSKKFCSKHSTLISLINVESKLTDFEKFHPPQNKNPPSTFIEFLDFSPLHSSFIRVMY